MKRIGWVVFMLLATPHMAKADMFELDNSNTIATKVAVLQEDTVVGTLDITSDGKYLAVDSWGNGGTDIWDLEQKKIIHHFPEGGTGTWDIDLIRFSPNGKQVAICHRSGLPMKSVDIYDTLTGILLYSIGDGGCNGLSYTPDGKELIRIDMGVMLLFSPGNNVVFYDTSSWKVTRAIRTMSLVDSYNPYNRQVPRIEPDKWSYVSTPNMFLVNPQDNRYAFHPGTLSISKDGKYLALSGESIKAETTGSSVQWGVAIIDISDFSLVRIIPGSSHSLDWNSDSTLIAGIGIDHDINIFDPITGKAVVSEKIDPSHILVRYTPEGKYLIEKVGKQVEIWDGQHKNLLQIIKADPTYIAVSRDGRYLVMGGGDLNILDATPLLSLFTHPNGPKGKVIVYKLK
jgi:WD40 repeat protein